ncbi:MAG: hypothetical protein L3J82_07925 [Planctomycetes bacterium]|nr:hypothetical protein [Planctomycetota bacterium]
MPLPRIFLFGMLALLAMGVVFWTMNVNFPDWLGAWFSSENPTRAGFGLIFVTGIFSALFFATFLSQILPGSGALKGILFGVFLSTLAIWAIPYSVSWLHTIAGQTRILYSDNVPTKRDILRQHSDREAPKTELSKPTETIRIDPVPDLGTIKPFFAGATNDKPWASVDSWRGRLLPFGAAFIMFGFVLGVFLSEKVKPGKV